MKLTREGWKIVDEQCQFCDCWDEEDGCTLYGFPDNEPVANCLEFEAHRIVKELC